MDGEPHEFCANNLAGVGRKVVADQAGLQAGDHRGEELFQGVALKAAPASKGVGSGEVLAVKLADFAAGEAPLERLKEVVAFQHEQIWRYGGDLPQIEIIPVRGGLFAADFFPEAEQRAGAGMPNVGIGLACFFRVVN